MAADNRTALLLGARACLDEQGYARTRARDVASKAGVSTAAIGYHFGTTDVLLVTALTSGIEEWSAELDELLQGVPQLPVHTRIAARWDAAVSSLPRYRGVLAASYELIARADADTDLRKNLQETIHHARHGLASRLVDVDASVDPVRAHRTGAVCYGLLSGLIVQWLVDPMSLPTGAELARGIQDLAT